MDINSKEYWNDRFSSGDWEKYDGELQSAFFTELFVDKMPEWLRRDFEENEWKIADYGCAEGSGTAVLARHFPTCGIIGYDISEAGIEKARAQHTQCRYDVRNVYDDIEETDVIFSSNTLEHLSEPLGVMRRLVKASSKHTVLMLPFEDDYGFKEHINRFSASFFPDKLENHRLAFLKVIDCREEEIPYWPGKQVLIVYTNMDFRAETDRCLAQAYETCTREYVERAYLEKKKNRELTAKLQEADAGWQEAGRQLRQKQEAESQLESRLETQAEKNRELLKRIDEITRQKQEAEKRLAAQLENQEEKNRELLKSLDAMTAQIWEAKERLEEKKKEKEAVEEQLEKQRKEKEAVEERLEKQRKEKEAVEERLEKQRKEKEAVEKRLEEQRKEKEAVEVRLEAAEKEKRLAGRQVEALSDEKRKAEESRQRFMGQCHSALQGMQQKCLAGSQQIADLQYTCYELARNKSFKLVHFATRVRHQLLGGNREQRKDFWKWLRGRLKRQPDLNHRYNPIFYIIEPLQQVRDDLAFIGTNAQFPVDDDAQNLELAEAAENAFLQQEYSRPDIIIFSVIDYDFRFQRPQHFAKRFAENGHRVFYINANFVNPDSIKEPEKGLYIVSFMTTECNAIYFNDQWPGFAEWIQSRMTTLIDSYAIRDAVIVLDYPNWVDISIKLRKKYGFKMVADYMDDATGFLTTTTDALKDNCECMLRACDLIVPSSQFLSDIARKYNDQIVVIRNGTEVEHFRIAANLESPHERPVVGYYGAVSHWFDWKKVCYLAKNLPQCDVVIIGDVVDYRDKLEKYQNIQLLGEKDYRSLPEYLAGFDVCLIPFDTSTDLIKATNPVKFYEYLSAGKRVVATEIPELEPYRDQYVYMANDDQRFLEYVQLCLEGKDALASETECIAFAQANDWQRRYEAFQQACIGTFPKVSIVVLTYNNLCLNRYCIQSILEKTAYPNYEFIIVDNLSTDGTVEYLRELDAKKDPRIKVILNTENLGFAGGNNAAIRAATGEYVVLLNNDVVVTRGWLTALVKHIESDPKCGMVGAVTNSIGNEEMIAVRYRNLKELEQFAYIYTQEHMGEIYAEVDRLPLFCTIIRKSMMDQYGMLDEGYKVGMFEDDDFAMLVKKAGYHFFAAEDCFVHHVNNASFKRLSPEKYQNIFNENRKRYEEKWNTTWTIPKYRKGVTATINEGCMVEPVE